MQYSHPPAWLHAVRANRSARQRPARQLHVEPCGCMQINCAARPVRGSPKEAFDPNTTSNSDVFGKPNTTLNKKRREYKRSPSPKGLDQELSLHVMAHWDPSSTSSSVYSVFHVMARGNPVREHWGMVEDCVGSVISINFQYVKVGMLC